MTDAFRTPKELFDGFLTTNTIDAQSMIRNGGSIDANVRGKSEWARRQV